MEDLNKKIINIKKELKNKIEKTVINNNLNLLKDDFKIQPLDSGNAIFIRFSTKYFPRPVKISFIQERIKDILETLGLGIDLSNDILIAVEEVISNIIEHSYIKKNNLLILFNFIFYPEKLIIEIEDFGKEGKNFNLYSFGNYSNMKSLHDTVKKTGGGMGVYLVKKIMDDVKYEISDNKINKIILTKKIGRINFLSDIFGKNKKKRKNYIQDIYIKLVEKSDKYALINIDGYINMDNSHIFDEQIQKIKNNVMINNFILKMENVEYISSSGIEILIKLLDEIGINKNICLVDINSKIKRVLDLTGFLKYFKVLESVEEAKKFFNNK